MADNEDPDLERAAAVLLLATARALVETIRDGLRPVARERMLNDLADALAPFDQANVISALHEKIRTKHEMPSGAVGRFPSMGAALEWLKQRRPFAVLMHPDGEFTVSGLGIPQCAVAKYPEPELAEIIAAALNQWAADSALEARRAGLGQ